MNETGFVESARGLATRAWHAADEQRGRIDWLFRAATARRPTASERDLLSTRHLASLQHFQTRASAAKQLIGVGDSATDPDIPAAQLASLTVIASIVLNLDEVLTRP